MKKSDQLKKIILITKKLVEKNCKLNFKENEIEIPIFDYFIEKLKKQKNKILKTEIKNTIIF